MRRFTCVKYFFLFCFFSPQYVALAQSSSTFGSYVGVMQHAKVDKDQFAKLDLIFSRNEGSQFEIKGILSFYFGDFGSKEYVTYHFDKVGYNLVTGSLVFDQEDQDITLVTTKFGDGKLVANVRSAIAGHVGTIILEKNGVANLRRDFIRSVTGQYRGQCEGDETSLQLMTYKTTKDTLRLGNPFGSYNMTGQVGDHVTFSGDQNRQIPLTADLIYSGSYDFYQGKLTLFGRRLAYDCSVDGTVLDCGSCIFTKDIDDSDRGDNVKPLSSTNLMASNATGNGSAFPAGSLSINGEYKGYLHHERLDQYQAASLNIVTFQNQSESETQSLQMSVGAKLFFGDHNSQEVLPYRFDRRNFNILSKVFVFERMIDDVDAVLQITELNDQVAKGVWYSILFGRVGTFEVRRGTLPFLPEGAKTFKAVSGDYESPTFQLRVSSRLDASPINTENPFYPQIFGGRFWYKSGIASQIKITDGSYDFYTGKIAFIVEDSKRIAVGVNDSNLSTLRLLWPPKVLATPLPDYNFEIFTK